VVGMSLIVLGPLDFPISILRALRVVRLFGRLKCVARPAPPPPVRPCRRRWRQIPPVHPAPSLAAFAAALAVRVSPHSETPHASHALL
jgi:hypothetical protein